MGKIIPIFGEIGNHLFLYAVAFYLELLKNPETLALMDGWSIGLHKMFGNSIKPIPSDSLKCISKHRAAVLQIL